MVARQSYFPTSCWVVNEQKKKMQIELQQHRLQTRKTKFFIADAVLLPSFSTSYILPLPVIAREYAHYCNFKEKAQVNVFLIFPFSEPTRSKACLIKSLVSLPREIIIPAPKWYLREIGWQVQYNVRNPQLKGWWCMVTATGWRKHGSQITKFQSLSPLRSNSIFSLPA